MARIDRVEKSNTVDYQLQKEEETSSLHTRINGIARLLREERPNTAPRNFKAEVLTDSDLPGFNHLT